MERALPTPAVAADASAATEVVVALELSGYGRTEFSQADLEHGYCGPIPARSASTSAPA